VVRKNNLNLPFEPCGVSMNPLEKAQKNEHNTLRRRFRVERVGDKRIASPFSLPPHGA